MRPWRVLHVSQPTSGGTAVVVRTLAEAAVAAGHEVRVASPAGGELPGWCAEIGASWVELPMSRTGGPRDLVVLAELRRLAAAADVVHLHSSMAGALGRVAVATLRRRPRTVFTPHAWSWYVGGRRARFYRGFESWAARHCDIITVTSAEERDDGFAALGAHAPIRLIENGVDTDRFVPDGPVAERAAGELLVAVGRFCEQKGQDRLIRAVARLSERPLSLRLVGSGPDEAALRALADRLEIADRVDFIGPTDPRPHLRAADVVVMPSRWEGMSLVLLEAMATGKAILTTDVGGSSAARDVAVIVPAADDRSAENAMVEALPGLLDDAERRQELGAAARLRAVSRYSIDRVAADFLAAYDG